jgi:hypothetical protein
MDVMARRGSSSGGGGLLVVIVVIAVIVAAARSHPVLFALGAIVVVGGGIAWWVARVKEQRRAAAAALAAVEEEKRRWRDMQVPPGPCTVLLTSIRETDDGLPAFLLNLSENPGVETADVDVLMQRAQHIGKQPVVTDVGEDFAVELKIALEYLGARVKISESLVRRNGNGHREPIPERVRHEVWRRDEGRCVDCGSRERLEFDHIVPYSKGGGNTARNLELRCEPCNRKKAATI